MTRTKTPYHCEPDGLDFPWERKRTTGAKESCPKTKQMTIWMFVNKRKVKGKNKRRQL